MIHKKEVTNDLVELKFLYFFVNNLSKKLCSLTDA